MMWVWIVLGGLVALGVLVAIVGALLPVAHAAARRAHFRQPAARLFAAITDIAAMPQWRAGLKSIAWLPDRDGRKCWREVTGHGPMDLAIEESVQDRKLVLRIVTAGSPFGGTWTCRIDPDADDGGASLQITENGEVYNVIFRALARFVFGHTASIEGYLRALGKKFGEPIEIVAAEPDPPPPRR